MCENPSAEALSQLDMRYAIAAKAAITYYEYGFRLSYRIIFSVKAFCISSSFWGGVRNM